MKKLLAIITALMLCLTLALPAFADASGPFISEISAVVAKKGGAEVYNWDYEVEDDVLIPTGEKFPEGAALVLSWESFVKGELYYYAYERGADLNDENTLDGFVKVSDLDMDLSPVQPKEENAYENPVHFIVTNKDGAGLYEGPSFAYKTIKTLSEGTEIEALYADGYGIGIYPNWSYTEVDGSKGWVCTGDSLYFGKEVKYHEDVPSPAGRAVTLEEVPLYKQALADEDRVAAKIPAGTELKYNIYYKGINAEPMALVEYAGKKGWIELSIAYPSSDLLSFSDGYLMVADRLTLYEDDDLRPGESVSSVEPYTIIPYDAFFSRHPGKSADDGVYENCYRVTVDGEKYWVIFGSELGAKEIPYFGGFLYTVAKDAPHGITLYASPDDAEPIGEIEQGETFVSLFNVDFNTYYEDEEYDPDKDWNYIEYDGARAWIHYDYEICGEISTLTPALPDPLKQYGEAENSIEEALNEIDDLDDIFEQFFGLGDDDDDAREPEDGDGDVDPGRAKRSTRSALVRPLVYAAAVSAIAAFGIVRAKKKKPE